MNKSTLFTLGAGAAVLVAIAGAVRRNRQKADRHTEKILDKSLKETFPASDATATQDYSIPANRL